MGKYIPISVISGNVFYEQISKNLKMMYGKGTLAYKSYFNDEQTALTDHTRFTAKAYRTFQAGYCLLLECPYM